MEEEKKEASHSIPAGILPFISSSHPLLSPSASWLLAVDVLPVLLERNRKRISNIIHES